MMIMLVMAKTTMMMIGERQAEQFNIDALFCIISFTHLQSRDQM
jgi:hypothetical protein